MIELAMTSWQSQSKILAVCRKESVIMDLLEILNGTAVAQAYTKTAPGCTATETCTAEVYRMGTLNLSKKKTSEQVSIQTLIKHNI
jgi:hypothetical protein